MVFLLWSRDCCSCDSYGEGPVWFLSSVVQVLLAYVRTYGTAVPWPEREVPSHNFFLFSRPPQAARKGYLNSYSGRQKKSGMFLASFVFLFLFFGCSVLAFV